MRALDADCACFRSLDLFCAFISKELAEVTSHGNLFNDPYMLSSHNRPFESAGDARSAADILQECSREGPETVKTVRRSIANHFRHAAQVAALSSTRAWRKQQKRRPRSKGSRTFTLQWSSFEQLLTLLDSRGGSCRLEVALTALGPSHHQDAE